MQIREIPKGERKPIPKCFLSYQSRSREWARKLKQDLVNAGCKAWFDDDEILAGHPIVTEIIRGINESDVFILIWDKSASESIWVSDEILRALHKKASTDKDYLIIVLRRDSTPLPEGLDIYKWLRFTKSTEYSSALKALLDSIAEKFGGYVFALGFPDDPNQEYTIRWVHTQNDNVHAPDQPYEETLSTWDLHTGKLISSLDVGGSTNSIAKLGEDILVAGILPNGNMFDPDIHDVIIIKCPDLEKMGEVRIYDGEDYPYCVRTDPRMEFIAIIGGHYSEKLIICDRKLNIKISRKVKSGPSLTWINHQQLVFAEDTLEVFDHKQNEIISTIPINSKHIDSISSDHSGRYVICAGGRYSVSPGALVIDLQTRAILHQIGNDSCVSACCISPNGRYFAWADIDKKHISIAEVKTGDILTTFPAHAGEISILIFDHTSQLLASGCLGGYVLVWNIVTLERITKFKVTHCVEDLLFSRDLNYLIVGNRHPDF
jgi:WD40 repeat protein